MSEVKRVHYKINGTESPVIHLECRTSEEQAEARQLARASYPGESAWRDKAIVDLYEWMQASNNYSKTIQIWAAVYIRCGTCARGFAAWCEECEIGPEDDLPAWLEAAKKIVLEKRWI